MSGGLQVIPAPESGVLVIHLLGRCNLHCQHCYTDSTPWRETSLPIDVVLRSLDDAKYLGVRTVHLTGGEPFLYADLPAVLSYAAEARPFHLAVSTNGTLVGRAEANRLKASHTAAQVSIDGDEAYHDSFRGLAGAFRAATKGIQELVAAGVPVTVVATICQNNLASVPWLAGWAADLGAECLSVQPLQHVGRGAKIAQKQLSQQQICELFMQVSDLGHAYRPRGFRFQLAYRSRSHMQEHPCSAYVCNGARCHRGVTKEIKTLVVKEDGTVLPEVATLNPRFALGNAREAPLHELVKRYFASGYEDFRGLCQAVYSDVICSSDSPIVPWDEILSERSWTYSAHRTPAFDPVFAIVR